MLKPGDWIAGASVIGAYCYAAGWVFYNSVFGRLGLEAEDVGIDPAYLSVRAGLLLLLVITLVSVLIVVIGCRRAITERLAGDSKRFDRLFWGLMVAAGVVSVLSLVPLLNHYEPGLPLWASLLVTFGISGLMLGLLGASVMRAFSRGRKEAVGSISLGASVASLVLLCGLSLLAAHRAGTYVGNEIHDGHQFRTPALSIFRVRTVLPVDVNGEAKIMCLLELGGRNGSTYLYESLSETIYVVPTEGIVLEQSLDRSCSPQE